MNGGLWSSTGALRLAALFSVLLSAACAPAVAPLPAPATPEVVLDAYLHTLLAGDCDEGRKLVTESFTKGNGELCGDTQVTRYRIDPGAARPSSDEIVFSTRLVTSGTHDRSIEPGEMMWFYSLTRQPDGYWRIVGGGSGP